MGKGKIKIFYSYCHEDSEAKERLDIHLSQLKDNSVIDAWHDKKILAGAEWEKEINQHLNGADIVLFLLSADFLSSENCKKELKDAKKQGKRIIPIILNDCAWEAFKFEDRSELRKSQAIPSDGKHLRPISRWRDKDDAWNTVREEIKKVCDEFQPKTVPNLVEHIKDIDRLINAKKEDHYKDALPTYIENFIFHLILVYMKMNCFPNGNKKYTEEYIPSNEEAFKSLPRVEKSFGLGLTVFEKVVKEKGLPMKWSIKDIKALENHELNEMVSWVSRVLFDVDVKTLIAKPTIPEGYAKLKIHQDHRNSLFIAAILGAWHENSEGEKTLSERLQMDSNTWLSNIREIKKYNNEVLSLTDGYWQVKNKISVLEEYKSFFYDYHLDLIKSISLEILSERHPMFDLNPDERFMAAVRGKVSKYSPGIRKGISETLAFLSIHSTKLENCTSYKPECTVNSIIEELFNNSDWKLWGSLNDILPILAEASPAKFLVSVEKALDQSPCPFDELFKQESGGITGGHYMTGLYWALERLAWSKDYLSRSILALAQLAQHDPGGDWGNRPANSIITILLPWLPRTTADVESRINSLKPIQKDYPDIAWNILLSLLPNKTKISSSSDKPKYRNFIPDDWENKISSEDYWKQIEEYANRAVEMAKENIEYVSKLVENFDNIPEPAFNALLKHLDSEKIRELPDEQRQPIWENMTSFIRKHRRFADSKWAFPEDKIKSLEKVAEKLAPRNHEIFYRHLFSAADLGYIGKDVDWETHQKNMESKRSEALKKIYSVNGTESIISLAKRVDDPSKVGYFFAQIADEKSDHKFFPNLLDCEESFEKQFIGGYVYGRCSKNKLGWLGGLDISSWTNSQKCNFLLFLPFENETWEKVDELLGEVAGDYWSKVIVNPFPSQSNLLPAIKNLLKHKRPYFALECIYAHYSLKEELFKEQAIEALLNGLSPDQNIEDINHLRYYDSIEIIKAIQDDSEGSEEELHKIEWGYLPLLKKHDGAEPKFLERRLSQEPQYFVEIIKLVYRSKNEKEQDKEISEERKRFANNAWELLYNWKHPPGTQDDGSFSDKDLRSWYEEVDAETTLSGHHAVAMTHLGNVLFYSEKDEDGLWIRQSVAELLNEKGNDDMRDGFKSEVSHSRGAYFVDPSGEPEKKLARLWRERAEEVDKRGFSYFATSLRELAKSYDRKAERIIKESNFEEEDNGEAK